MKRVSLLPEEIPGLRTIRQFEGGVVRAGELGGRFYLVKDERSMAEFLDEEDGLELLSVLESPQRRRRDAYVRQRGWG